MTRQDEYRKLIAALGLSQTSAAGFLQINERTSRRWAATGPPEAVLVLLRLIVQRRIKPGHQRQSK